MKKNTSTALLAVISVALIVVAIAQYSKVQSLNRSLDESARSLAELKQHSQELAQQIRDREDQQKGLAAQERARFEDEISKLQSEIDRLKRTAADESARYEKKLAEAASAERSAAAAPAPAPVEEAAAQPTPAADDRATSPPESEQYFKSISKMMKNPAMKEMVRSQQKSLLDMTYKSLFDSLNLTEEQSAKLKELLLDKQMKQVDLGLEMMDGSLTEEQRKDIMTRVEAANAESDKAVQEILNEKDFEWYKTYEETKGERTQLNMFNQSLDAANRLTPEQEDSLTLAFYEARSDFASLKDMQNPGNMSPDVFTPERIDQMLADLRKLNEQYIARATPILNEEQLKAFKAYVEQQQAMQEMGMKMAARMFGKNTGSTSPAAPTPQAP